MTHESYGFAFDSADLASLGSDDEEVDSSVSTPRAATGRRSSATRATDALARDAEREMEKMKEIVGKLKTGTATRDEKARLKSLNAKMSVMRKEMEKSATRGSVGSGSEIEALRAESKEKAKDLLKSFKQKQVRSVIRAVCSAESVDLAFIIDCTSSMQPYIENVKKNIKTIVRQISNTNGNLRLRLAVVAYRDLSDGEKRHEVMDFMSCVSDFELFVGNLRAIGGADTPEDMAGGIQLANQLSWYHPTRVAFLIADCPCHGKEFHAFPDSYPSGTPGINIIDEMRTLQESYPSDGTMTVHFGRIGAGTDSMLARFKSAYGIDLEVVAVNDATKLKESVTSSVRRSIFKTMTVAGPDKKVISFAPPVDPRSLMETIVGGGGFRAAQLKRFSLVSRVPSAGEWKLCPALKVNVFRNSSIKSMEELKLPIGFGLLMVKSLVERSSSARHRSTEPEHNTMFIRRATNPFAQGEIRIAFHGQLAVNIDELSASKNSMVMKSFKHVGKGIHDRQQYLKQMEVSNIAHFLSKKFNASSARPGHCAHVTFLPVCVVEEQSNTREKLGERRFCVEPPLPSGSFKKFSNNTGYWAEDILNESLLRFADFTYKATGGYLMVTDLQGVHSTSKNKFYLTDPVILSTDILRFGNTNLGAKFLKKCIDSTRSHLKERGWK